MPILCTGILEENDKDDGTAPGGDEVLAELKKKQAELKAISQHNMTVTKRLYKMAKEEMARQDLRKRIIVADADVSWRTCIIFILPGITQSLSIDINELWIAFILLIEM